MTEEYVELLIQKYADGTASKDEVRLLMEWYRLSPIEEVPWQSIHPDEQQEIYTRMLTRLRKEVAPQKKKSIVTLFLFKAAALFILLAGTAIGFILLTRSFDTNYITVANPTGKIQLVRLPDSSLVWLNAASTLQYASAFNEKRYLKLEGEAYFDVKHDPSHPFKIKAGEVETIVIGTSFSIKAYSNETDTRIAVSSGRVKVESDSKELAVLTPARQLQFDRKARASKITAIDTSTVASWRNGRLQFDGQPLSEIAKALERWYGVEIVFANPQLQYCRYYMNFDNSLSVDKLLTNLSVITEMRYSIDSTTKTIKLSGQPCH